MKKSVWCTTIFLSLLVSIFSFVPAKSVFAQSEILTLDINLSPALENAQVLGLTSLGVDNKGSGPLLFWGSMTNNTDERLENLYFEFILRAGKVGILAKVTQQAAYPFSMEPRQTVFGDNNDIKNEQLPGIDDKMKFDGGLTPEGEDFVESLGGATTLPVDIYTLTVTVFRVTNELGKEILATQIVELGGSDEGVIVDEKTILLKNPGDIPGAEANITNPFPQFSWEGEAANIYRVVVVRANGQDSPESLIETAKSSPPTNEGGSLQQFENLDLTIEGNTLQYPSSGVQPLTAGQTYYWQISTEVKTAIGTEEITSELWMFKLAAPSDNTTLVEIGQDAFDALIALIGEDEYASLTESGYAFESIEVNNQIITGATAIQFLSELIQKIDNGEIILNNAN